MGALATSQAHAAFVLYLTDRGYGAQSNMLRPCLPALLQSITHLCAPWLLLRHIGESGFQVLVLVACPHLLRVAAEPIEHMGWEGYLEGGSGQARRSSLSAQASL